MSKKKDKIKLEIQKQRSEKHFHIRKNLFIKFLIGSNPNFYRRHFNLRDTNVGPKNSKSLKLGQSIPT